MRGGLGGNDEAPVTRRGGALIRPETRRAATEARRRPQNRPIALGRPYAAPQNPREGPDVRRVAQLLERALADLPDALAGDAHELADLLEGHRLGAFLEAVVQREDLPLARRQVTLEDAVDELAHQLAVGHLLDLAPSGAGEALAERAGARGRGDRPARRARPRCEVMRRALRTLLGGLVEEPWRSPASVGSRLSTWARKRLGAGHPDQRRVLVERDADAARLLGERLEHRLAHPPDGVGDELHALVGIELPDRLEEAFVADGDELAEVEPVALVLLHVGDDEPEVRRDQPFGGRLVALLGPPGQAPLFFGIRDQGSFWMSWRY